MKRIVGIFNNEERAVNAVENLKAQGFADSEISIITQDEQRYEAIKNRTGMVVEEEEDTSGVAAGAAAGGAIGGLGGLLLGLGALAIPGVGPIVAAGPIASALVGALAGGAVGGLAGALVDYGVSADEAKEYAERINQGDIMILVDDPNDDERREAVYDNFRRNDSFNKESYSHADTLTDSPYYTGGIDTDKDYPKKNPVYSKEDVSDQQIEKLNTKENPVYPTEENADVIQDDYKKRNTPTDRPLVSDKRNTYGNK